MFSLTNLLLCLPKVHFKLENPSKTAAIVPMIPNLGLPTALRLTSNITINAYFYINFSVLRTFVVKWTLCFICSASEWSTVISFTIQESLSKNALNQNARYFFNTMLST